MNCKSVEKQLKRATEVGWNNKKRIEELEFLNRKCIAQREKEALEKALREKEALEKALRRGA